MVTGKAATPLRIAVFSTTARHTRHSAPLQTAHTGISHCEDSTVDLSWLELDGLLAARYSCTVSSCLQSHYSCTVAEFRGHYSLESIPLPVLVVVGVVQLMKREVLRLLSLSFYCNCGLVRTVQTFSTYETDRKHTYVQTWNTRHWPSSGHRKWVWCNHAPRCVTQMSWI